MNGKVNCAGRECPERDGCRRYEWRVPIATRVFKDREMPVFEWASLDVERMRFGDCKQRLPWVRNG